MRSQISRASGILQEEGPTALTKSVFRFVLRGSPLKSKHPKLIKFNSHRIYLVNQFRYRSPPHPFDTVQVAAAEVEHAVPIRYDWGLGRVKGGNWDHQGNLSSLEEKTIFKGLRQRFEENKDWEETVYVKRAKEKIRAGENHRGYSSVERFINDRCEYIEELYNDIKQNGYFPQHERDASEGSGTSPHTLEPIVAISRNGDIYFTTSGQHRFVIAQMLNLKIPCHVAVRHENWQLLRDKVHQSQSIATHREARGHPDMQDLISPPDRNAVQTG